MANQTRKFTVVLEPEEDGGFTVRVPSLPEIVTYGETEEEACLRNGQADVADEFRHCC